MLSVSSSTWVWVGCIGFTIACVLLGIVPGMIGHRRDKKRAAGLPAIAGKINAEYLERDDSVMQWFDGIPFYSAADYAVPTGVMRGLIWDVHCIFFDLEVVTNQGESTFVEKQTVAMFHFGPGAIPAFDLQNWGRDTRFQKLVGMHDKPRIDFDDDPAFSEKFRVTGDDAAAIRQLLTAKLRAFLDAHDEWTIHSTGTWIAITRMSKRPTLEEYHAFVGEAAEFLGAFMTR